MALEGELTPQEQEIVDFFAQQDFGPYPTQAEDAVKAAQKLYDKAQVAVDKVPFGSPDIGSALRYRDLALVQLLRAKAFRSVIANRYVDPVKGPKSKFEKRELSLASQYKGDPTDFLTIATQLKGEIDSQNVPIAQYRQAESATPALALAQTEPKGKPKPPVTRPAQGAVGQTAPAPTPAAQPASAGQFRMAEQAAGQPTAATMADVERRKPAARATRKPTAGGAGGGVDTTGIIPPSAADEAGKGAKTPKGNWQQIIQREFGWAAAYIGIDPMVDEALGQLARNDIDTARFDAKIRSSEWWKNTNDFVRQWDLKERTPGSTAQKEIGDRVQAMQDHAMAQFGVAIPADSVRAFARESLRQGMLDKTWQNGVGAIIAKGTDVGAIDQLRAGNIGATLRRINSDYGYDASTDYLNKSISAVASGTMTANNYRDQVLKQVKSLYGKDVGELLDQGYSVADIAQPYNQIAARTLEVDSVDMKDPKYRAALDFTDDKGNRRKMTLGEWETRLRTDNQYGWQYTEAARTEAQQIGDAILKAFGKIK